MRNENLTQNRVRNVMKQIPKAALEKRTGKVRNTLKQTFTGMKTLLGQLQQGSTDKLRAKKNRKKRVNMIVAILAAVLLLIMVLAIIYTFSR